MKDLIAGAEILGIPATILCALVGLFLAMQVIGAIVDFKTKTAPEALAIWKYFKRKKEEKEKQKELIEKCTKTLDEINAHYSADNITKRNDWMIDVNNHIKNNETSIQTLHDKMDKLLEDNSNLKAQLKEVQSNVLDNEADRLRTELYDCGSRCRRDIRLHPEEMEHIRAVFKKYSTVLHQNSDGEREYNFIVDYYNNQSFPAYHKSEH